MSASATTDGASSLFEGARGAEGIGYAVKLPAFEGPLDLLLHLIRLNEVEITDIPVAKVAEQYVEYIGLMRELNLDVAGEYLVMAATLAWIKSRMLLPPDPSAIDDAALDPRAELAARLLEYQRFKEVAAEIGERPLLGRDVFPAHGTPPERPPESEREIEVGVFQLVEAFRQALKHAGPIGSAHEVEAETITVRDQMIRLMEQFSARECCEFVDLVCKNGEWAGRSLFIATFLALLELTRIGTLSLYQSLNELGVPVGPIQIRRLCEPGDAGWESRISELM
jgi:segregation and condensation protein A